MQKAQNERSLIPLIVVSIIVSAPLIFILGIVAGSQVQLSNILTADSLSSWISAIATVAIAVLTFVLAKETWYLRLAQIQQVDEIRRENIRPNVSVAIFNSPIYFNLMMVEVCNLGKGIARNIKFKFLDRDGNNIGPSKNIIVDEFLNLHIFSNGMHSLGIGQKVDSFLFSFFEMNGKLDIFSPFFKIEITYEDVAGTKYSNELTIDFQEFKGRSEIGGGDPLHKIADDVKKLREEFQNFTRSSSKRINVNTYSSVDREEERVEREKERATWMKKNEEQSIHDSGSES